MSNEYDIEDLLREVHGLLDEPEPIRSPSEFDSPSERQVSETPAVPSRKEEKSAEPAERKSPEKPSPAQTPPKKEKKSPRAECASSPAVPRWRKVLRSVPFFTTLALITVIAWLLPLRDTVSEREKRELEHFPRFSLSSVSDGSYFSQIGVWFSDGFTFRDRWMDLGDYIETLYGDSPITITGSIGHSAEVPKVSGSPSETAAPAQSASPSPQETDVTETQPVEDTTELTAPEETPPEEEEADEQLELEEILAGKEYTADSTCIVMDGNVYPTLVFNEYYCDRYADHMSKAAELLEGKARVFSVLPLRSTSPMLPKSFREYVGLVLEEDVLDYIFSKTDDSVYCVDTLTPLAKHSDEYIYFHSDHHWTALGAYYCYEEWAKVAGVEPVTLDNYTEGVQGPYTGTYYHNSTAKNPVLEDEVHTYDPPGDIHLYIIDRGTKDSPTYRGYEEDVVTLMRTKDKYCAFLTGDHAMCTFVNNDIEDESACLIVKDSNGNPFSYYFTQHYKYVYVLDYRYYNYRTLTKFADTYGVNDVIFCLSMFIAQSKGGDSLMDFFIK